MPSIAARMERIERRRLSPIATAAVVFALGFGSSLLGDACHVASHTTRYEWDGVPEIWRSAIWFPFAVGGAILAAALVGRSLGLPSHRRRGRADAAAGVAAVVALYALTAALRGQPDTVSVVLCAAAAGGIWTLWDPSPGALGVAVLLAVVGPLAEIAVTAAGAASYAANADGLGGVPPWLPCLYFAAGSVASGLWAAMAGEP